MPSKQRFEQLEKLQLALKARPDESAKADFAPARAAPPVPESMRPAEPPKKRMKTKTPAPVEKAADEPAPKTPPTMHEKKHQEKVRKEETIKKEKDGACNAAVSKAGKKDATVAAAAVPTAPPSAPAPKKRCADAEPRPAAKAKAAKSAPKPSTKLTDLVDEGVPEVTWANFEKLKAHFGLTEDETTATLVGILGLDHSADKYWDKFRARHPEVAAAVMSGDANDTEHDESSDVEMKGEKPEPKLLTRAERELIEDSQLPPSDDDDDLDGTEYYEKADDDEDEEEEGDEEAHVSPNGGGFPPDAPPAASPSQEATSAGSSVQIEPPEMGEPVIEPLPSKDDEGECAREALARRLKAQPTPARTDKVGCSKLNILHGV